MQNIYRGKTKDVFTAENGNYVLVFKDDMTGANGKFDPGANTIGLTMAGAGMACLVSSVYFFELLEKKGYPTHYISSENNSMTVKPAKAFGGGLEVICRYKALGSFTRRYGDYIKEGAFLDGVVEMTLKDDKRGDPLINEDSLIALGILKHGEYSELRLLMKNVCDVIKRDLEDKGLELCDIKLEFGKDISGNNGAGGKLMIIDEISGGNMRVLRNGESVDPLELPKILTN